MLIAMNIPVYYLHLCNKMKLISGILLFWFSLLTTQPAVAKVCQTLQSESCCKKDKKCSSKKENKPCKEEDKDCCAGGLCTPCSICSCCFTATVEKENFSFARNAERIPMSAFKNAGFLSGFTSQCFQPPELAQF